MKRAQSQPCAEGTSSLPETEAEPSAALTEAQIKHMVDRFLGWRLPENFNPDNGISFKPTHSEEYMASLGKPPMRHDPVGTNLFDARQAETMVRHMVEGIGSMTAAAADLRALLEEGLTSAWCDAVIGCMAGVEPKRAAMFRDHFYDWQRRTRAALASEASPPSAELGATGNDRGRDAISRLQHSLSLAVEALAFYRDAWVPQFQTLILPEGPQTSQWLSPSPSLYGDQGSIARSTLSKLSGGG